MVKIMTPCPRSSLISLWIIKCVSYLLYKYLKCNIMYTSTEISITTESVKKLIHFVFNMFIHLNCNCNNIKHRFSSACFFFICVIFFLSNVIQSDCSECFKHIEWIQFIECFNRRVSICLTRPVRSTLLPWLQCTNYVK